MIKNKFYDLQQLSRTHKNPPWSERIEQLYQLKEAIKTFELNIQKALHEDLKKPLFEVQLTEIGPCYQELDHAIRHLKSWMSPRKVNPSLPLLTARSQIIYEPKGVVLIISPWNYPFQLAIAPVIAALSAGNRVVIKPSELALQTSKVIAEIFNQAAWQKWVTVVEGGLETSTELLSLPFDHIFFTGSTSVGKVIMNAAAKNLATVTLELGGKSPVILDEQYDLVKVAKTLAWGKFLNLGQTCVAPDYVWAHHSYQSSLVPEILRQWDLMNQNNANQRTCIINQHHELRLQNYVKELAEKTDIKINQSLDKVLTVIEGNWHNQSIGQEEIFGPLLPIRYYQNIEEVFVSLDQASDALSLYIFSERQDFIDKVIKQTRSGGICINDVILHLSHPNLPFGGRGQSGQGAYHGESGFYELSHRRSIMHLPKHGRTWEWLHFFYPPYTAKKTKWLKWI